MTNLFERLTDWKKKFDTEIKKETCKARCVTVDISDLEEALKEAVKTHPYSVDDTYYSKTFVDKWLIDTFGDIAICLVKNQPITQDKAGAT